MTDQIRELITAASVVKHLENVKEKGTNGYTACCPAHDDNDPSLSVTQEGDKVLFKCWAGCSQEDVLDALKGIGAWPSFNPTSSANVKTSGGSKNIKKEKKPVKDKIPLGDIISTYSYVNEHGEIIYQNLRYEPGGKKTFRQRRPDGAGKWTYKLGDIIKPPYNLPGILAAERGILIVEGEKDCDTAAGLEITATNSKDFDPNWAKYFKGKSVFIIPDNDEAGAKYAEETARILYGTAESIKIIELPNLPEKGDFTDWIAAGGTKSVLAELIGSASEWDNVVELHTPELQPTTPEVIEANGGIFDQWLMKNDNGLINNINNAQVILTHDAEMREILAYNEFSKEIDMIRRPPWDNCSKTPYPRQLTDVDDTRATAWLERKGVKLAINTVHSALISSAYNYKYNPLQDYLKSIMWDECPRMEEALITYFGCSDTPYNRAVSRKFLIGSVARAMRPGCKMDTMLILEGPQGLKKSTAVAELYGHDFFTDELGDLGSKDAGMQVQGVWAVEVAEMSTMGRAEANRIKEWITRRVDRFRPPYGRNVLKAPRQSVLIGTVNPEGGYLKDATGGRRFWPVKCSKINIDAIKNDRDQIWAEAVECYLGGEEWWFDSKDTHLAESEQQERYESDPWEEGIDKYVNGKGTTSVADIMKVALDLPSAQQNQFAQNRVAKILVSNGWLRKQRRVNNQREWVYVK